MNDLGERRRAEPCVAQRAAAVEVREDWLPKFAATHSITSYPVEPHRPVPTFRMLAARKPRRMRPIYDIGFMLAQGWHGHHPSCADRGFARPRRVALNPSRSRP